MTDIVGSTEHASELGDSAWRELVQQHHRLIRAALRRHGGREIDTAGDGFFATFDAPGAAVACALDIATAVKELGIDIRAGVHVGEVEQIGRKVGGITVPIASRIMGEADPGEVLVSSTVRDLAAGSRLMFDDRGVKALKGVPGEWHVYVVARAQPEPDETGADIARERRASAVRRAGARPVWRRRPRLVAAGVVGLALVVATGALLVVKPWQTPALAEVKENSIGIIDPGRSEVIGEFKVGTRPGGIAVSESYAWVTNTGANTLSKVDLTSRAEVDSIPVGLGPKGIAVAQGSVWVANSGDRTVSRVDIATSVVTPIEVGNGPTAIALAGGLLWVANATDSTVVPVGAETGAVGQPVGVGASPIALAADENGLWVLSEDEASVSHLDPATGATRAAPIQLNARPSALALDEVSVWVTTVDGRVTRFERATPNGVLATIPVGGRLSAIALGGSAIWVGDHDGTVHRIDPANTSAPPKLIATKSAVAALAEVNGDVWLAAHSSLASHLGDTLRIVEWEPPLYTPIGLPVYANDPLHWNGLFNASWLTADGLTGHRRVGGAAGSALLPNLATSIIPPTNGGLTYTFQLRADRKYSTGTTVRASDFRRAIERSFLINGMFGFWGPLLFPSIVGADACTNADATPVETCDLPEGILTDDAANTVTFNLSSPDPDLIYKLAHPAAYPVPDGIPMNDAVAAGFPGTGPYMVTSATDGELRVVRNPYFEVWNAEVRPDGFPEEIVFNLVDDDATRIAMVKSNEADVTAHRPDVDLSPELFAQIRTQYPGQWHEGSNATAFVEMNTSIAPFDNAYARQALNFALDRREYAPPNEALTCQLLPPGFPGYKPFCPYTISPDEGGRWKGPDLVEAQRLAALSGTLTKPIVVGPSFPVPAAQTRLAYLAELLIELGYQDVNIDTRNIIDLGGFDPDVFQIGPTGWAPDYLAPSTFFGLFRCPDAGGAAEINYCNQEYEGLFEHAAELQTTDPAAALQEWAALDHRVVELALLAPAWNGGPATFVSARVGNYQYSSTGFAFFDQMWVR